MSDRSQKTLCRSKRGKVNPEPSCVVYQIILISDIHANYAALKAVFDKYANADEVWCLGDIVLCGPSPSSCINLVRKNCRHAVKGNHDEDYVRLVGSIPEVCCDRKTPILKDIDYLQNLPYSVFVLADGVRYLLVHDITSMLKGPRTALQSTDADVIICGHTHIASITHIGRKKIVNAGTVGQPEDGNYRAQCMIIENGEPRFERVDYSLAELERAYAASSMPDEHRRYYLESACRGYGTRRGIRLGPFSAGYTDVN